MKTNRIINIHARGVARRLKARATQTKSAYADSPHPRLSESPQRDFVCVARAFSRRAFSTGIYVNIVLILCTITILLTACSPSSSTLSNVAASTDNITPGSSGVGKPQGVVEVHYTLNRPSKISALLRGLVNVTLLEGEQDAGDHVLRFNGVVTDDTTLDGYKVVRRVAQSGDYNIVIMAGDESQSLPLKVNSADAPAPTLTNLSIRPAAVSPNSDAQDDVAEVTFRTEQTSTLSVDLASPDGRNVLVFAPQEKSPGEQNIVVNGQDLLGNVLPDGAYTVTVRAQDRIGNRVEAQRPLTIEGGGEPAIEILKVEFSPKQIMLGGSIAVSVTVKNVGNAPLRSQGPDPGYAYTTNDSYSSVENGRWVDRAGLWRVGVDWDGNSGGAAYRYPFRWGFGKTLMPGETVVTGGKITLLKQERKMWFFAGVLQEGVRIVRDRLGITAVDVGF